jgi:hypothetical protein
MRQPEAVGRGNTMSAIDKRRLVMTKHANAVIHFMDGTSIVIDYPKQAGNDPSTIASNVRKALDQDKLIVEVDGSLLVIPMTNIKYVSITPLPDVLPAGVLRHAHISG